MYYTKSGSRRASSGGVVVMATAQPSFNMAATASTSATAATTASASDLVGGGSGGGNSGGGSGDGGGGSGNQQQGVSPASTVNVVSSNTQQQTNQQGIVSANSVSITAVPHNTLQQNGSVDGSLDSPGDSSNGAGSSNTSTAQVTAQVVVSSGGVNSEGGVVNAANSEQNPSAGGNQTGTGGATIVGSPHYITVTVSDTDAVGSDTVAAQGVHPTYVQYVEGGADQAIYAATNGQMAYPVYTVGETGTMYTPASGQYYSGNSTAVTYSQVGGNIPQGANNQLLAQGNGAYLIQQGVDPETAHTLIAAQRASPQTVTAVQWLLENYETAEGVSLPRSTLYNHYLRHCNENKLDPVNAASFGKLIRSVFVGLRTRRLGTRGNSKYHYYGIRVKPGSPLNQLIEDGTSMAVRQQPSSQKRYKFLSGSGSSNQKMDSQYEQGNTNHSGGSNHSSSSPQHMHHHQYLGDGSGAIPDFPEIEFAPGLALPEDCTLEDVDTLRSIYREHCEAFLDAVVNLEFQTVESLWREFWRSQDNNNGDECEEEKYLSKTKLYLLCKCGPVQQFVRRVDYLFYQNLVEVLIPDVLRPIPSSLTQAIRNFAKGLESWLTSAMVGCPEEMMHIKVSAVSALAQTLRRYTSLNHLAQAARAVLQNSSQINQMLVDLNRVDFHNVQEQASWVCQCDDAMVQQLEADFKLTLQQQNSLEQWAAWLKGVVTQVLKPYVGKPNFAKAARQFLLKWSFYSSMVIRDLTLRSAASFGSFHLIRLLYDEYMFFLIEHQVAQETGETPIAVMGEIHDGPGKQADIEPMPSLHPKYNNNPSSVSGYLQPGPCNGGVSLMGVPVQVETKINPTLLVGANEVSHHPSVTKRLKIS